MGRGHTPFGYRIENGCAVVNAEEAEQIRQVYAGYLSGQGYIEAGRNAGLSMMHASVKRLLQNKHYLGDDFYPAIIDRRTFEAAEQERLHRLEIMGRNTEREPVMEMRHFHSQFTIGMGTEEYEDPYEQAAYLYSLIESED